VSTPELEARLTRYRPWLAAAAVYNLLWGLATIVFPTWLFRVVGMEPPGNPALWQVVGMFVLVFAPGYWWASRDPVRHRHLVLIGLLGKTLGPLGFAWSAATGQLPLAFGATILANDLVWWPSFALFVRDAARGSGGWRAFLSGH
jgi:small multidrug resistance pump